MGPDGGSDYANMPPLMDPATGVIQPLAATGNNGSLPAAAKQPATLESKAIAPPTKKAASAKRCDRDRKGLKPTASLGVVANSYLFRRRPRERPNLIHMVSGDVVRIVVIDPGLVLVRVAIRFVTCF